MSVCYTVCNEKRRPQQCALKLQRKCLNVLRPKYIQRFHMKRALIFSRCNLRFVKPDYTADILLMLLQVNCCPQPGGSCLSSRQDVLRHISALSFTVCTRPNLELQQGEINLFVLSEVRDVTFSCIHWTVACRGGSIIINGLDLLNLSLMKQLHRVTE